MSQLAIDDATIERLRSAIGGEVVTLEDSSYDEARRVWNGMIDRRPALVARCISAKDVAAAIDFGRTNDLVVSVRGGAHSSPGYSTCDGGIVIDLQLMNAVRIDPEARTARVQGGAIWSDVDAATQEHGLAVTGGRVSSTGVGGLSLGSGSGWLERMYGVTCESLASAEVVLADGRVVRAGPDENQDLLWALRGGGGNFGVVTEFEFRLHPVGPILTGGMLLYPRAQAREIVRLYRDFIGQAPDEVCGGLALITAPPEEFVPEAVRGRPAVGIVYCYVGPVEDGQEALRPLREAIAPIVDLVQPMPYTALQQMLDAGNPYGIREYFKIAWLQELPDEAVDVIVEQAEQLPAPFGQLILAPMGGAVARTDNDALALTVPQVPWAYFCLGMWMDPAEDERNIAWVRGFAEAMEPFGRGTAALPNFIDVDQGVERLRSSYGEEKYTRLTELKQKWDPDNVFRLNQNIAPSGT
jgi:FAD/FMN-containing dehydrogenase